MLNEAQVAHYRREGYVVVERLFGADMLARVEATIRELIADARDSAEQNILEWELEVVAGARVPRRIYNPFDQHEAFRALACDARLLDGIESLVGPNITLQHSKLNMKPAKVGSVVEWHQDLAYFPHTNDDLVSTLIYLDDATAANGCLQVLPRHHTHYFDHTLPDGSFAGMITEEIADGRFGRFVPLPAPAGSVILMHCLTPHSSLPNRSDRPRRTLIFEYRAADSFPIYFGERAAATEKYILLRGRPASFARCGGPAPFIPRVGEDFASLYEIQERTKRAKSTS